MNFKYTILTVHLPVSRKLTTQLTMNLATLTFYYTFFATQSVFSAMKSKNLVFYSTIHKSCLVCVLLIIFFDHSNLRSQITTSIDMLQEILIKLKLNFNFTTFLRIALDDSCGVRQLKLRSKVRMKDMRFFYTKFRLLTVLVRLRCHLFRVVVGDKSLLLTFSVIDNNYKMTVKEGRGGCRYYQDQSSAR